ncbi:nucleotidyltransferase family protein [Eubacterium sp. LFL-14]|uniref:Nucleotidyltransferase family protein n=1 Tax=Eubacterium album TaxID=2978477 RepID=A0ABT2M2E4_9FIRM|nr:nucleotidyltransferase family protein [Eubacterium sp. LFL-14]MCT7399696.1 nucleotidyltransferase family protein [Eubacterium sp. LFL-14]
MVNINLRTYYTAIELIRNFVNNKTIEKDFLNERIMNMPDEENSQEKNENTGEEASMANKAYKENSQATNNAGKNNSEANNIGRFYYIAKKHNLVSLMAQAMEKMGFESDSDIWKCWLKEKNQLIYKSVLMDVEREAIQDFFEENNIWYMLLKGMVIRKYYPAPELREMADNDILFDNKYSKEVYDFMTARGYKSDDYNKGYHDEYLKPPAYNFEMHRQLVSSKERPKWYEYYKDVKSILINDANGKNQFYFSDNDFYVYFIVHTYKHFLNSGMGLRTVLDVYLYLNNLQDKLDFDYIEEQLKKLDAYDFEQTFRSLAFKMFGENAKEGNAAADELQDSFDAKEQDMLRESFDAKKQDKLCGSFDAKEQDKWWNSFDDKEHDMLSYIFDAGTYGNLENSVAHKMGYTKGEKKKASDKVKYIFRRLFPSMDTIEEFFPFFYKHKWAIPFLYIYRIGKIPFTRRKKVAGELREVFKK